MNGLNRIPTLIRMCLALVITNLGMTLIQTRLKILPPAPLSLYPLLPPPPRPVRCPPRSRPPFAHPPVCAPPSFPRRQVVQQCEPAPAISTASPFTHPPFVQAASRPTGVATPFASPHLSRPPFPPPPFSRKRGCFFGSAHPLPVVRGHLPAWFLATALGTAPPRSPAPPACLALCALAEAQERQCATVTPQPALLCDVHWCRSSVKSYQDFSSVMNKIVGARL